ncbi:MAG: winged helix-turn-helix domain-containing protein [Methylococcaceae bacterium]|nr:winged helix-turn-helix domain-containing protein [Methylococcaceae bacterium]
MDLPVRTVRLYLTRWGFTPQRPLQRAFQQKPEAVEQWLQANYSAIAARAKAEGAEMCWGGETAVASVEHSPRGYAPK